MRDLTVGKEYSEVELDFLTGLPWKETRVTYMGIHPYAQKHIFASQTGGTVLVPEGGRFLDKIEEAGGLESEGA